MEPWLCRKCGKDMAPRPGAVLTCAEVECGFWRIGFSPQQPEACKICAGLGYYVDSLGHHPCKCKDAKRF